MQSVPFQTETATSATRTHASTSSVTTTPALLDTETDPNSSESSQLSLRLQENTDLSSGHCFQDLFHEENIWDILFRVILCLFYFPIL